VNIRTIVGKAVKQLRTQGHLPAVIYGYGTDPMNVQVETPAFIKVLKQAGNSSLVSLALPDQAAGMSVIIQNVQKDPISDALVHVDFYKVNLNETITTEVPLEFDGIAPAVKELGGILVKSIDHLEVECLPANLVHELHVDLSGLKTYDDVVLVKDIKVPSTITVKTSPDEVVATVQPPRSEEDLKALETPTESQGVESVEVLKKGKDEEAATDSADAS